MWVFLDVLQNNINVAKHDLKEITTKKIKKKSAKYMWNNNFAYHSQKLYDEEGKPKRKSFIHSSSHTKKKQKQNSVTTLHFYFTEKKIMI